MNKFVILTMPRTGSSTLIKSLNSHPEISCTNDILYLSFKRKSSRDTFKFIKLRFLSKKTNYTLNYLFIKLRLTKFLNTFFKRRRSKTKAKGFKLGHQETQHTPGLLHYLKNNNVKVILLVRKNIFRHALSMVRMRTTNNYRGRMYSADPLSAVAKVHVEVDKVQEKMQTIENEVSELTAFANGLDFIIIYYEDFVDWDGTMNKIFDFLNVSIQKLKVEPPTVGSSSLEDIIDNFEEVAAWLKQNNYNHYID